MDTNKDNSVEISTTKNQNKLDIYSLFKESPSFLFVYKKTEKLVTAVYMVTNLFPDDEPIKWSLRKKSSNLLSFMITYKDMVSSEHNSFVDHVKTSILEVVSFLEISSHSGLISHMNFSMIQQEFLNLTNVLNESVLTKKESSNILSTSFFDVPLLQNEEINVPEKSYTISQHISDIHPIIKDKNEGQTIIFKKTNRQNIILQLLKKKKDLTIKDISQVIKDCSEKTIQRELINLITAGVLKRVGDRRWSRYLLA